MTLHPPAIAALVIREARPQAAVVSQRMFWNLFSATPLRRHVHDYAPKPGRPGVYECTECWARMRVVSG